MRVLFILFIVMPILEMAILIQVGKAIGGWYTIGLVLLTAVIGVNLLKRQGLRTLMSAQRKAQVGDLPVSEIGEGLLLAVAGALLLTPGFVTDAVGFALLTPSVRAAMAQVIAKRIVANSSQASFYSYHEDAQHRKSHTVHTRDGHVVVDAEFEEIKENTDKLPKD